ncbi:TetR/AcrR family transcriptional regulator [Bacillus testis]|uniref:TetR/AcrR family transcriptional regulator n=1 Tax=Bacillus testis TaxID=1622072 RepID=UPI00067F4B04|nr:TetR/AcrR family transcriptional regulator C-terminal domain-containing protein [Bacillus testis]
MKSPKVDRRVIRTKRLIRDSLTDLMIEKGFDGLTVSDITERADINRGTFYLHYRDKYDLLEQSEAEIIEEIKQIKHEKFISKGNLVENKEIMYEPSPYIMKLLDCIKENAEFIKVLLGPNGDPRFRLKLKEEMRANVKKNITEHLELNALYVPVDYASAFAVSAQLGVLQHWLDTGMKQSSREVATYIRRIIFGPRDDEAWQQMIKKKP